MEANENTQRSLQENFSVSGPISLNLDPEDPDPVASSTKMFEYYLGDIVIDVDHYEQLMEVGHVEFFLFFLAEIPNILVSCAFPFLHLRYLIFWYHVVTPHILLDIQNSLVSIHAT